MARKQPRDQDEPWRTWGVVTALEMTLYPVRELYAGALFFPIQRSAEVLHAWREWTGTVPDKVTSLGRIVRVPPVPEVPEQLRGRAFALVEAACLGDADTGAALIQPLRQLGPEPDTFDAIPPLLSRNSTWTPHSQCPARATARSSSTPPPPRSTPSWR
jgi:hypothetical protein